jgi:tRNA pseudouridine55 synthase
MSDGLINLLKPVGISSAKALYRVRGITGIRKSGHAGTLDPAADGVLILCMGKGTKLVESLMDLPKAYRATARLDVTSESFDSDRPLIQVPVDHIPNESEVVDASGRFVGRVMQAPPAVSAIKVAGRPSYKLERKGKIVSHAPRPVMIYSLHVLAYRWPEVTFEMACGRGTYVRALIRDWGADLGCGGCLTSLTRTAVGPFRAVDAWTLDRLENANPDEYLVDLADARTLIDHAKSDAANTGISTDFENP